MDYVDKLNIELKKRNIKIESLGVEFECSVSTIRNYLKRSTPIPVDVLQKFALKFNVPIKYFFEEENTYQINEPVRTC